MSTPDIRLEAADAIELAELLGWLADWIDSDTLTLALSISRFNNAELTDTWALTHDVHADLHRFAFLLGAGEDHDLFGANP